MSYIELDFILHHSWKRKVGTTQVATTAAKKQFLVFFLPVSCLPVFGRWPPALSIHLIFIVLNIKPLEWGALRAKWINFIGGRISGSTENKQPGGQRCYNNMANVVSGRISRIVSCCTDEDGNHLLEVEYCSAGKRSAMISREQFLEDGGRRAKRLLADWDKGMLTYVSMQYMGY